MSNPGIPSYESRHPTTRNVRIVNCRKADAVRGCGCHCQRCEKPIPRTTFMGPSRSWCSNACRQAAYRDRHRAEREAARTARVDAYFRARGIVA